MDVLQHVEEHAKVHVLEVMVVDVVVVVVHVL